MAHPPVLPAPVLRQARLQLIEGADPASTGIDQRLARSWQRSLAAGLSPTGRLALVEYRAEDPNVPIKRIHKMSVAQARREMAAVGLRLTDSVETLPQQHLLFFKK